MEFKKLTLAVLFSSSCLNATDTDAETLKIETPYKSNILNVKHNLRPYLKFRKFVKTGNCNNREDSSTQRLLVKKQYYELLTDQTNKQVPWQDFIKTIHSVFLRNKEIYIMVSEIPETLWSSGLFQEIEDKARENSAPAQYLLGYIYQHGKGVEENYEQAFRFYEMAAKQGLAIAQYKLGKMYEKGLGIKQDFAKAFNIYQLVCQWFPKAQYRLGKMHEKGLGVVQDYDQAQHFYSKLGYYFYKNINFQKINKKLEAKTLYRHAKLWEKKGYQELALRFYKFSANKGCVHAQYHLAEIYSQGLLGIQQDDSHTVKWLAKAADQGHVNAQFMLGMHYMSGKGVWFKDKQLALKYFSKAVQQNHEEAEYLDCFVASSSQRRD